MNVIYFDPFRVCVCVHVWGWPGNYALKRRVAATGHHHQQSLCQKYTSLYTFPHISSAWRVIPCVIIITVNSSFMLQLGQVQCSVTNTIRERERDSGDAKWGETFSLHISEQSHTHISEWNRLWRFIALSKTPSGML